MYVEIKFQVSARYYVQSKALCKTTKMCDMSEKPRCLWTCTHITKVLRIFVYCCCYIPDIVFVIILYIKTWDVYSVHIIVWLLYSFAYCDVINTPPIFLSILSWRDGLCDREQWTFAYCIHAVVCELTINYSVLGATCVVTM